MARKGKVAEGSFVIEQDLDLEIPVEKAWEALVDVSGWWCHYFADTQPRLTLEPRLGGRFFEDWGDGQGALFGTVTYVKKPEILRLSGPLGMDTPVNSVYEFRLTEKKGRTRLTLTHRATGLMDRKWAKSHKNGWKELWKHLRRFAEEGVRFEEPKPKPRKKDRQEAGAEAEPAPA